MHLMPKDIGQFFENGMKRKIFLNNDDKRGLILNLGSGNSPINDAINLDLPEWDARKDKIPFDNESASIIHAYHFFEHIPNVIDVLYECQRVLVTFGILYITVPWWNCKMAHQDINHLNSFSLDTWKMIFENKFYSTSEDKIWKFKINFNAIIGIKESNLAILTQLTKQM